MVQTTKTEHFFHFSVNLKNAPISPKFVKKWEINKTKADLGDKVQSKTWQKLCFKLNLADKRLQKIVSEIGIFQPIF